MRGIAAIVTAGVTLIGVTALAIGGWYYSSEILAVPTAGASDPTVTITHVDIAAESISIDVQHGDAVSLSPVGLRTSHGQLKLSGTPRFHDGGAERHATLVTGVWPNPGDRAAISVDVFDGDPAESFGLAFHTVPVAGELGPMPGWQVIPDGVSTDTWVVLIHGRGATRAASNRYLPMMHDLGLPTFSVAIRNDPQVPHDPQGYGRFGFSEWRDLDAAIDHLVAHREAEQFVLVGSSQGASVALMFLRHSAHADRVRGAVLISPLISLDATLYLAAQERGIPGPAIRPLLGAAKIMTRLRSGMKFSELEHQQHVDAYPADMPFLITHGDLDATVPYQPSAGFAKALGPRAVFVRYPQTGHVREWSTDRTRFELDVRQFIESDVLQTSSDAAA